MADAHPAARQGRAMTREITAESPDIFRDILADIFSTPGAYSVMLSWGWTTAGGPGQRQLRCRHQSDWQAEPRWRHDTDASGRERQHSVGDRAALRVWPEHVLIACEEQPSRTTRDRRVRVRTRVPRSFDTREQ